jgi:glycosyltransferase involved in cell wall biosynthesis/SAM-dependent methyltransferase
MNDDFYRVFEDKYRGSRELIKSRLRVYLSFLMPLLALYQCPSAIDLGCGRGEWLELLREIGVEGHGVDIDEAMLTACRELGLAADKADAIQTVEKLESDSQAIVSGFHFVEHIPFPQLQTIVREAFRVLKPAGLLILETPNPENIMVATANFYLDPTHQRPIPPGLLSFLPEFYGFARTKIIRLQEPQTLADGRALTLTDVLSGVSPDYGIIAQKDGPQESLALFDKSFSQEYGISLAILAEKYAQQLDMRIADIHDFLQSAASKLEARAERAEQETAQALVRAERAEAEAARAWERAARAEDEVVQSRAIVRRAEHFERQLREREAQHWRRLQEQEEHYSHRLREQEASLEAVYRSHSWRLTAPYRALGGMILRRRRQGGQLSSPRMMPKPSRPTLFIECTHTFHSDVNSGIQRVVRNAVRHAPVVAARYGFDVVPVIVQGDRFVPASVDQLLADKSRLQASPKCEPADQIDQSKPGARSAPSIMDEFQSLEGSVLLLLDSAWHLPIWRAVEDFKQRGGRVVGVIYDLIPITHSHTCVPSLVIAFQAWLREYLRHTEASIAISRATGNELRRALASLPPGRGPSSHVIDHFYLGSELDLVHTNDRPRDELRSIFDCDRHVFLMVGSIEPRKNHSYVLDAFERHWAQGRDAAMVIIGRQGWRNEQFLDRVASHKERGRRVFVLRDASDAELDYAYRNASALIIASDVEGFGLPVVEAFQRGLPVLCSNIPVFREIADGKATFFELDRNESLTEVIEEFCRAHDVAGRSGRAPQAWITWQESTDQLFAAIVRALGMRSVGGTPGPVVLAPDHPPLGSAVPHGPGRLANVLGDSRLREKEGAGG